MNEDGDIVPTLSYPFQCEIPSLDPLVLDGRDVTYMGHGWKPTFDIFTEKSSSSGFVFSGTDCNPQFL